MIPGIGYAIAGGDAMIFDDEAFHDPSARRWSKSTLTAHSIESLLRDTSSAAIAKWSASVRSNST